MIPRPRVAKPDRWQQVQRSVLRTAIAYRDLDEDVFGISFRILHYYVEVTITVKNAGIDQLKLRRKLSSSAILFNQLTVRVL